MRRSQDRNNPPRRQADPDFAELANRRQEEHAWFLHNYPDAQAEDLAEFYRASRISSPVLTPPKSEYRMFHETMRRQASNPATAKTSWQGSPALAAHVRASQPEQAREPNKVIFVLAIVLMVASGLVAALLFAVK